MDGTLYRLVFANSAGTDVSNEVALHVGSNGSFAPARPTDLTATAVSSSQINLSWNDNSSNESDFIIQRKAGSTGTYATVGTAPSSNNTKGAYFDNLGLVQGTPYYYQVIAAGSPNSDPSNEASAATQINTGSTRALTVNSANPGSGVHIYVSPNDTNGMADGDTSFFRQYTSTVTATVYASATWNGNSFQKWQRDGQDWTTNTVANVIMDTSHTMTAVYATPVQTVGNYTVAVSASPLVGGTVTGNGSYAANASAMIQATAAPGYTFLHWTQNTSGGATFAVQPQVTFQVTSNLSLVANFTQDANSNYTVTTTAEPANGGTATGAGSYAPSSNVNLSAQPASGYVFDYWTENGVVISYSQSYQYPQVSKSHDFVAHFHVRGSGTPDVVPSMALDRQFYFPGETINITGDVKNKGSVASNACQLYWIVSDSAVSPPDPATLGSVYPGINFWMPYYPSIPAGVAGGAGVGLQLKDYNGVALAPGNYYVWMLFDPGNTDGETAANRVNNNLVVPFTVLPPPANNGPDVIPHDFTVTPAIAFPSGTLDVKGGIRNAGNVASAGFKYYVSISTSATVAPDKNALNVSGTVPALGVYVDAGADSSFALPSTLAPGNYYLWVMVNPENDAGEPQANQSNNNVVLPLTVIAKPRTFTITATASSNGSANGDGTYVSGALVPLIATPAIGYRIVNWTEGATVVSTSANYTFIANADRSLVATFAVNTPPNAPNNITPVAGAANQSVTSTLIASAFVDPDSGDTQTAAQWIVRRVSDNQVVFDSGEDAFHKTSISVTPALDYVTAYQWQVRYKDTSGAWSTYSTPTNFTTQQKPVSSFVPYQGSYSGVIQSGTSSHALSGLITIGVTSTGAFTASVNFGGQISSLRGVFRSDGTFSGLILRKGLSPLTLSLTLDTTNGTNSITGTFSDGVTTATLTADRAAYSKMIPAPAEKVGSYTVLLPPDPAHPEATAPQGAGYGTLTVDSAGAIRFAGVLGDGTKASQGASLTADGTWPFYVAPYKLGGSVSGWIAFLAVANVSDFNGTLNWFKLANPTDALYRAGFSTQISLIGSRYTVPPIGTRVLFANTGGAATFTITGGNLNPSAPQEKLFFSTLNTVSLVSGPPFTMKLTLTTGVFAGTFADPGGSKPRAFSGVLFQKQNLGAGLFIGNTQTGSVNLTPQ